MRTVTRELLDGTIVPLEMPEIPPPRPSIHHLINAYARLKSLRAEDLTGKSQAATITSHRHRLMYMIRRIDPTASQTLIGRYFGGRDMATVHEAIRKVDDAAAADPTLALYLANTERQVMVLASEEAKAAAPAPKPWQLLAAVQVLRDDQMTDAEARKVALSFLQQLEAGHG